MGEPPLTPAQAVLMEAFTRVGVGANADARMVLIEGLRNGEFGDGPTEEMAYALRMLGEVTRKLGDLDDARRIYQRARVVCRELGSLEAESGAVEGLAQLARREREPALALRLYDEAAELALDAGDGHGYAAVLSNKGNYLGELERFAEAEPVLRRALATDELEVPLQAALKDNLSYALAGQDRFEDAISAAASAAEEFTRIGASYDSYVALGNVERFQRVLGRDADAVATFVERHELIMRSEADHLSVDHYLAYSERVEEIEEGTAQHFAEQGKQGFEAAIEIGAIAEVASELEERGVRAYQADDYAAAESALSEALSSWQRLEAYHAMPRVHRMLGLVYTESGQIERGRAHLLEARDMAHGIGDAVQELAACVNLCRFVMGSVEGTEFDPLQLLARARALHAVLLRARSEGKEEDAETGINVGSIDSLEISICLEHGALELAEPLARRALASTEQSIAAQEDDPGRWNHELCARLIKLYSVLRALGGEGEEEATEIATRLDLLIDQDRNFRTVLAVQATLGTEGFSRGDWDERTLGRLLAACDAYEELRARAQQLGQLDEFAEANPPPFAEAAEVAIRLDRLALAFELIERSKSRSLLDALSVHRSSLEALPDPAAVGEGGAQQLVRPANVAELAAALRARPADPMLIELFVGRRNVYAFTLDGRGELEVHEIGETRSDDWLDLHDLVRRNSMSGLGSGLQALGQPALRDLSAFVGRVAGDRPVYLCPHQVLHALPLHLVEDGGVLTPRPRTFHLPSGSLLAIDDEPDGAEGVLVAGDPVGDLPFAGLEAKAVARRFGVRAMTGPEATASWLDSALSQGHPPMRLIHLACHAFFHPGRGERSGLLLSEQGEPVLATIGRLVTLDWSCDLAFLSACSSGQHEVRAGDELAGISRALVGRGARALVVALWEVPDLATYLLAEDLYRRLPTNGRWTLDAISVALAAAQRTVRDLTAREVIEVAVDLHERGEGDRGLEACALSAAASAHAAAGDMEEWQRCHEAGVALAADRPPAPDIGAARWDSMREMATAAEYGVALFTDPANWAAFVLVGRH